MEKLRQLIRESINEYIKAIDEAGYKAGIEAKLNATQDAIAKRKKMTELAGLDEDIQGMIDERKVKEVNNEIKALEKSLTKLQKQLDKLNAKSEKSSKVEDTEEKEIVDEVVVDENIENSPYELRKKDKDMKFRFNYGMEDFEEEAEEEPKKDEEKTETDEEMNIYETLYMQKLAGIISETEYKAKVEEAKKK